MFFKKKGAILIEAALSMSLNLIFLIGGMEIGWYLYVKQGLAGAAGQAVELLQGQAPQRTVEAYMVAMGFSDSLINSITITKNTDVVNGSTRDSVTVSLPLQEVLLFGGTISNLGALGEGIVSSTAYMRQIDI